MVKKLILAISKKGDLQSCREKENPGNDDDYDDKTNRSNDDGATTIDSILQANRTLFEIATTYKNKITEHYQSKRWDRYKKLSNEYEFIFFSSNSQYNIANVTPVSRSFFKLWEILHDFENELDVDQPTPMKAVFLAEGPGGFFEAFHRKRESICDECHGITLRSCSKTIPDWKTSRRLPLKISYGKDGTGNLYNIDNIISFAEEVGQGSVDLVTADGGFDFSSDFNNQEDQSLRLIVSEITAALYLQKDGGKFLLKIYDCFNQETLKVLHVLHLHYDNMYMIKPLTSRPANSERYVLCTGFNRGDDHAVFERTLSIMTELVRSYDHVDVLTHMHTINFDKTFMNSIVLYNVYYTMRQVVYIQKTINYIKYFTHCKESKSTADVEDTIMQKHKTKAIKWCIKYGIPYKQNNVHLPSSPQ